MICHAIGGVPRILPRYHSLQQKGIRFSLSWFLNCSDQRFEERLQGDYIETETMGPCFFMGGKLELPGSKIVTQNKRLKQLLHSSMEVLACTILGLGFLVWLRWKLRGVAFLTLHQGEARVMAEQACFLPCTDDGIPIIGEIPGLRDALLEPVKAVGDPERPMPPLAALSSLFWMAGASSRP
ncbi:hypothetical protein Nepgr_032833 [Nepenthes gracilis]|uniref:Uncharacterized protein n=1 Tax=Nepenthes gracilis TaxID=150966 RepID=A0AAD3Y7Z3_NEPGR|nr:hypothetical protein Nepgr_032833 [Nepenthes gracilis]